ncbi:MAG: HPP family protein [Gammaproteobacteria bacterium]|nr:HPP family protein [Gammaproteobacteria bacterium]
MFKNLFDLLGVESQVVSHKERIISGVGAFLGIFIAFIISRQFVGDLNSIIIAASMGSSAVLLFAVPHGSLSQPWALLGGTRCLQL